MYGLNRKKIVILVVAMVIACTMIAVGVVCLVRSEPVTDETETSEKISEKEEPGSQPETAKQTKESKTSDTEDTAEDTKDTSEDSDITTKENKESETLPVINNIGDSEWNLILVNPWNYLPEDFSVDLAEISKGYYVDSRIYDPLSEMLSAARAEGLDPLVCSAYRTYDRQVYLYNNQVNEYLSYGYSQEDAEKEAATWVAIPGTSEHHTGLAVDIVSQSYQVLDSTQEDTEVQKWLMANSYKYGFILRYPNEKKDITGINYEPWHYRYVGKELAEDIYRSGLCFEEYLESINE